MSTDVSPLETEAGGSASVPPTPPSSPPALGPLELARWAWRQLTSMRTALVLLFLLALAAVPGSVVPQQNIDSVRVGTWQDAHPTLTPVYRALGLFNVYGSVWFSAIYILLMVSLVGCVIPRLRIYWRALRARPPRVPRHLGRLPESRTFELDEDPEVVLSRARAVLRSRRYRVAQREDDALSAEKGYLREAGNLLFHLSVLIVLVGFAVGQLFGYKGGVITIVGQGFSNTLSQYDDFAPGRLFDPNTLSPLSLSVDDFHVTWLTSGPQMGQPKSFDANITYRTSPGAPAQQHDLAVNHPLKVGGASVFLVGHGYAPVVTVRGGDGRVAYRGPVVFLPQDSSFASFGVIKADTSPEQLGFEGLLLPTYGFTDARGPFSQFPDTLDPVLSLIPYHGDLGQDSGAPQSVYSLDKAGLKTYPSDDPKRLGPVKRIKLSVGQRVTLPGGTGSIRFDGVQRFVKLQVSHSPGTGVALGGVVLAILGLMGSLFIRPRRAWVRVKGTGAPDDAGRTVVEVAGLDRSSGGDLRDEVSRLEELLRGSVDTERTDGSPPASSATGSPPASSATGSPPASSATEPDPTGPTGPTERKNA